MSDEQYTPSVDEVRDVYADRGPLTAQRRADAFDRMIADVARRAKAEALRGLAMLAIPDGPMNVRAWLRQHADRIEADTTRP